MQHWWYLTSLIFSLSGMALLDWRLKLGFFWDWRRTLRILLISEVFFLAWDITGISLSVFSVNPDWVSGWYIFTPNLPVEEFLFLGFLGYITLLIWRWRCLPTS